MTTTVYLINRMPKSVLQGKSPYEMFHGIQSVLDHLRTIGCLCYITRFDRHDKFSPKADACVLLGYSSTQKGYLMYNMGLQKLMVSRGVTFQEEIYPFATHQEKDCIILFLKNYFLKISDYETDDHGVDLQETC